MTLQLFKSWHFLIKITHFEKTGSIGKVFVPPGKFKIKFNFRK